MKLSEPELRDRLSNTAQAILVSIQNYEEGAGQLKDIAGPAEYLVKLVTEPNIWQIMDEEDGKGNGPAEALKEYGQDT